MQNKNSKFFSFVLVVNMFLLCLFPQKVCFGDGANIAEVTPYYMQTINQNVAKVIIRDKDNTYKTIGTKVTFETFIIDYETAKRFKSGYGNGVVELANGEKAPIMDILGTSPELGIASLRVFYSSKFSTKTGNAARVKIGQKITVKAPNNKSFTGTITGFKNIGKYKTIHINSQITDQYIGVGVYNSNGEFIGLVANPRNSKENVVIPIDCTRSLYGIKDLTIYPKKQKVLMTQLIQASARGDKNRVRTILRSGIDVNMKDKQGQTALIYAITNNQVEIVKILLLNKADPNVRTNDGCTPLMYAAQLGYDHLVSLLISKGANINDKNNYSGDALNKAIWDGRMSTIKLLLNAGQIDVNDHLVIASWNKPHIASVIQLLIDHGADPNWLDNLGYSPLYEAVLYECRDNIRSLLSCGADPNMAGSPDNYTPIDVAKRPFMSPDILDILLSPQANKDMAV